MKHLLLLGSVCLWACRSFGGPVTIYVAPGGDDHWSGARPSANQKENDGPMATVSAAIVRSRELRRTAADVAPIIVLRGGDYVLDTPLVLRPEDSGLTITGRKGEKPVISGETRITGWRQSSVNPNVWEAEVPAVRGGAWQFHELFVNGHRKQRSRLPASGYYHTAEGYSKEHPAEVRVKPGEVKPEWAEQGDVELVLYSAWAQSRNQIRSVSAAGDVVTLAGAGFPNESEKNPRFYIENAPDALQPGSWRLDRRSGTVTYWPEPGEDMRSAVVTAPRVYKLVQIEGIGENPVRGVKFEGLTFAGADWPFEGGRDMDGQAAVEVAAAFEAQYADSCVVTDCRFTRLGGYAVGFERGCRRNKVIGCDMFDLGGGGVRIGESDMGGAMASPAYGNSVTDNHIHHIGMVNAPAVGVLVLLSASNDIAHNEINDTFYTAISVGWTWGYGPTPCRGNMVEFNHLHDIGQGMLSDMGGIYTLGLQPGAVVRNNLIHDVTILEYGGWGLYTDEGSSGIVLESNVVYRCQSAGFHQHYGETNLIYNNIFALNKEAQLQRTRPETHCGFLLTNNIIYFDSGSIFTGNWSGTGFVIDHNIYFDTRSADSTSKSESYLKFKEWQRSGHEPDSLFVDPMFVAPDKADFRLRSGSPALRFGFHPLDLRDVGPRKKFDR